MENNNKKSKALIITTVAILVLVVSLFLIYKNRDIFGVKTSSNIAKIFSPLTTTDNRKKETIQAGEDIKKGDGVVAIGREGDRTIVRKANYNDKIMGYADEDIPLGYTGNIILSDTGGSYGENISPYLYQCSDGLDNDGDGKIDNADPNCHLDGDLKKVYLPDHDSEDTSFLGGSLGEGPDLIAGTVSPFYSTVNSEVKLSSIITNIGSSDTTQSSFVFFTITEEKDSLQFNESRDVGISVVIPSVYSQTSSDSSVKHTFKKEGIFYVRACADKKSATDSGSITELNEDNNCGNWTTFTVSNSLPTGADKPACSDGKDNDGDGLVDEDDPQCHKGGVLSGQYLPDYTSESHSAFECNDTLDNDGDGLVDKDDPQCHLDGDLKKEYLPKYNSESIKSEECNDTLDNDGDGLIDEKDPQCHSGGLLTLEYLPFHNSEKNAPAAPNVCLEVEKYPLTFTDIEKAKLADLLRKFYLISPTLRTEDDIALLYEDITDQQNFSVQLSTLIKECYAQTSASTYTGPRAQYGNPWFKYNTRGSFLSETQNTKSYCWSDPKNPLSFFDKRNCAKQITPLTCEKYRHVGIWGDLGYGPTGCTWVSTIDLEDFETILNIW